MEQCLQSSTEIYGVTRPQSVTKRWTSTYIAYDVMHPFLLLWDIGTSVERIMISAHAGVIKKNVSGDIHVTVLWPAKRKATAMSKTNFPIHLTINTNRISNKGVKMCFWRTCTLCEDTFQFITVMLHWPAHTTGNSKFFKWLVRDINNRKPRIRITGNLWSCFIGNQ